MENDVKKRVKYALKELNISCNALSNFRQLTRSTVTDQVNGSSKMGVATIEALLAYCPDISAEWLLRGTGDMLISKTNAHQPNINPTLQENKDLEAENRWLRREINGLYERIAEIKGGAGLQSVQSA